MGLLAFKVTFDRKEKAYFAGEIVNGKVLIELDKEKAVKDLRLQLVGIGKVFSGFSASSFNTSASPFDQPSLASEVYFDKEFVFIPSPCNTEQAIAAEANIIAEVGKCTVLPAGKHEYAFQFQLPSNCPSSFEEPYAQIKYYAKSFLTFATKKSSTPSNVNAVKASFSVSGIFDLNNSAAIGVALSQAVSNLSCLSKTKNTPKRTNTKTKPKLTTPGKTNQRNRCNELSRVTSKLPWLHCISIQPISYDINLTRDYLVPGEYVQFTIEITNRSPFDIQSVTLSLHQETKYHIDSTTTKCGLKQRLCIANGPTVAHHQTEIWETNKDDSLFLQIPSVPPTNLGAAILAHNASTMHKQLVSINYWLQFEMELKERKSVKEFIPIVIGTIPNKSDFKDFIGLKKNRALDCGKAIGYPELCDPVFEDAFLCNSISARPPPPPNLHSSKRKPIKFGSTTPEKPKEEEEESDDEYFDIQSSEAEFHYIPKYVNYNCAYGLDLSELMGPPSPEVLDFWIKRNAFNLTPETQTTEQQEIQI